MADSVGYPLINSVPRQRESEKLVAEHYLRHVGQPDAIVRLGSDEEGVPDCFAFAGATLHAAIEVTGYILGDIHDIRRVTQVGPRSFHIDAAASFRVHESQPHPTTLIRKKILGGRKYRRFDAEKLVLLIHSDVMVTDGTLRFAMLGPMHMSPSCDNFSHHRVAIMQDLRALIAKQTQMQWDEVWLIDYTEYVVAEMATFHRLWPTTL